MSELSHIIAEATVRVESIEDFCLETVAPILKQWDFCRITGLVTEEQAKQSLDAVAATFSDIVDHPVTGEAASDVMTNFQKMSIGRARHGGVDRPRFMRTLYNPVWCDDIYKMRDNFTALAQVRNILSGMPRDFAIARVEDDVWTAARIHHFPSGGGFMVDHKDTVLPKMLKENDFSGEYYQLLLLLSQKGEDFETGGGTVELNGEMIEYEDYTLRGDILVYNGSTVHGVNDIDPHLRYVQSSPAGRYSALATLFKKLG
ncbi:MAG: hypothetical protein GKR90_20670 [Pseudomonadales bacterium]|nr:hypothetical protein [Pseudomonadales bacterium]